MADFFLRVSRMRVIIVVLIVIGAFFVDGYSLFYRYVVVHQPLSQKLTTTPSIGGRPITLVKGLDLQGGTELVVQVCAGPDNPPGVGCRNGPKGQTVAEARDKTIPLLQQRVNGLGVSEAAVAPQGDAQILIQIPGVGLDQARATVGTTAKLHFATAVPGAPDPRTPSFQADQERLFDSSQFTNPAFYPTGYHWKIDDALDASDVQAADVGTDANGQVAVDITFNQQGAAEWNKLTTAAFAQPAGTPLNRLAIFLDNKVITAPQVNGVSSNKTQITGGFTTQGATLLASQISAGALPAEIATVQSSEVSATLGQQTVQRSLIAGAVGLLIIVLFMVSYYRFPGVLACLALFAYAGLVLALYKLIPVTVTLAGLAGFVLSVGMAVDANVLIFERIRDELRHGRALGPAVETGFRRAFPAIRDSNVSTIIACTVLALLGTSVVRGFAITLGLGVLVSFFSAVTVTRALMAGALRWRLGRRPNLYTEIHEEYTEKPPRGRFDIVSSRNWYFAASLAIIIPGILAIIFWGFRLGLDFRGGYKITAALTRSAPQSQVYDAVHSVIGPLEPQVQANSGNQYEITFLPGQVNGQDPVPLVQNELNSKFGIPTDTKTHNPNIQEQFIGPSIASGLVQNAIILILVASALIAVYLALAFRRQRAISAWRFSACAFFKLLHDVFVLAGIWAILGHFTSLGEVDTLFVTAILTSVAFSIHDTIVVFDRVRENLENPRFGPRLTFDQVINLSTVQTMTRSLNTSLTVVFVLLALVLFGGSTITGFVLALLIGIVTGTYSSIFNASTLLVAWQKAEAIRTSDSPPPGQRRVAPKAA